MRDPLAFLAVLEVSDTAKWLISLAVGGGVLLSFGRYLARLIAKDKLKGDFVLRSEFDAALKDVDERFARVAEEAAVLKEMAKTLHQLTTAVASQTVEIGYLRDDVHDLKQRRT